MADKLYDLEFNGITFNQGWQEDGKTILTSVQPQWILDAIVDENKALANNGAGDIKNKESIIGARIPTILFHNWKKEWQANGKQWGQSFEKFLYARLNSPDYKHLRFVKL